MPYMIPAWLTQACVYACWVAAVLFNIIYTLKAPWWRSWMGRNLFAMDTAIAASVTPSLLKWVFGLNPETEGFQWFFVADIVFVTLTVAHRTFLLLKVQRGWQWTPDEKEAADER